jgi:SUMO ligase MMS21 Smc5/6 complex component
MGKEPEIRRAISGGCMVIIKRIGRCPKFSTNMDIAINKVSKLVSDNEKVLLSNLENGLVPIQEIALDLERSLVSKDPTELPDTTCISTDPSLMNCDNAFRSIVLLRYKHELETEVLKSIKERLIRGQLEASQVLQVFDKEFKRSMNQFEKRMDVLQSDDAYIEFRKAVWEIRHRNRVFGFGDAGQDEDIQMVSSTVDYKCPITVSEIHTAHHYDRSIQGALWTLLFRSNFRFGCA